MCYLEILYEIAILFVVLSLFCTCLDFVTYFCIYGVLHCCKISLLNPCMLSPKVHEHCDYILHDILHPDYLPRQAKWDGDSWQNERLSFHPLHPCNLWHNLQGPRPGQAIHLSLTLEPMLGFCHREVVLSTSLYMY